MDRFFFFLHPEWNFEHFAFFFLIFSELVVPEHCIDFFFFVLFDACESTLTWVFICTNGLYSL